MLGPGGTRMKDKQSTISEGTWVSAPVVWVLLTAVAGGAAFVTKTTIDISNLRHEIGLVREDVTVIKNQVVGNKVALEVK